MYEIHVKFKDLHTQTIRKATIREAYTCYAAWKEDSRITRVSLYHAHLLHMSTFSTDLSEEANEMHTMLLGRGGGNRVIVFYRKLGRHGQSLSLTLPRRIKEAWGAKRQDHIKFLFHDNGTLTLELVRENADAKSLPLPFEAPDDPGTARALANDDRPEEDRGAGNLSFYQGPTRPAPRY